MLFIVTWSCTTPSWPHRMRSAALRSTCNARATAVARRLGRVVVVDGFNALGAAQVSEIRDGVEMMPVERCGQLDNVRPFGLTADLRSVTWLKPRFYPFRRAELTRERYALSIEHVRKTGSAEYGVKPLYIPSLALAPSVFDERRDTTQNSRRCGSPLCQHH